MSSHPTLSYHQAAARGASPLGQVVVLYDILLRDFMRALAALKAGNVETRVFQLNHAVTVIEHLLIVLDYQRGGEAAKQFERLYKVTLGMIVEANFQATPKSLERLIEMYGGLRQAWYEADQKLPEGQLEAPSTTRTSDAAESHAAGPGHTDIETPQHHWST